MHFLYKLLLLFIVGMLSMYCHAKEDTIEIIFGAQDAPVTIYEYASLTCGPCAEFHATTFPILKKKYIDTGKVKLVFRHFPLDSLAIKAAQVISSVPRLQQAAMLIKVFESQEIWIGPKFFVKLSELLKLSLENIKRAVANEKVLNILLTQRLEAEKSLNIEATPTFIINGKKFSQLLTFEEIEPILLQHIS